MIKSYRRHQAKSDEIGLEIHSGLRDEKIIVVYVTPGGGKTLLASVFAHQILKRVATRVLVICPRTTLQAQMRDGFTVPERGLLGGLVVGYISSGRLFKSERAGCVTTYQDVIQNPARWLRFVSEQPTLVILDEAHHLQKAGWGAEEEEERGWTGAVTPIVEAAKKVLLMTGTMKRDNGSPLAFVEYNEDREPKVHVRYTRRDALDEHAVLNVSVKLCDGDAVYWHQFSKHEHALGTVSAKEEPRALRTLLNDARYRNKVLDMALADFATYRDMQNPSARMIVICANQKQARGVAAHLRDDGSYRPVLAISSEADAHRKIARFRDKHEGDILVTCQMAYEGLDVPDCTHLVALTNFRSRPWLEQALSRVTRFDPKCKLSWNDQCAYLYVPSDPSMASFLSEWLDEQDPRFSDPPEAGTPAERTRKSTFIPESGELTGTKEGDTHGVCSEPDQRRLRLLNRKLPFLSSLPTAHRLQVARVTWPDDDKVPDAGPA